MSNQKITFDVSPALLADLSLFFLGLIVGKIQANVDADLYIKNFETIYTHLHPELKTELHGYINQLLNSSDYPPQGIEWLKDFLKRNNVTNG